jgi:hypothetical protein
MAAISTVLTSSIERLAKWGRPSMCENEAFPLSQHEIREKKEAVPPDVVVVALDFHVFTQPRPEADYLSSIKQTVNA